MSELLLINLSELEPGTPAFLESITAVAARVSAGEIAIAPIESSYIFLCDAFNRDAVIKLHQLRGDAPGTACQVLVASTSTLPGIAQQLPDSMRILAEEFWPGLLTLMVRPNSSLNWDLGDGGVLDTFAVRVPNQVFLQELIAKVGPVAIASASMSGQPPSLSLSQTSALPTELSIYIDGGDFQSAALSTVVAENAPGYVHCTRIGAISLEELRKVLPTIGASN